MIYNMTMKKVNIFEAKAHLSEYVEAAQRGEQVIICRRNRPVAELKALGTARTALRPTGGVKGLDIPSTFFDPLPDHFVDAFYDVRPRATSRVAERPARFPPPGTRRKRSP